MNDIKLTKSLSDIDLLSKWFKLQYIRISSTKGDIDKNDVIGTCLGGDENGSSSGVFNVNARGYAVINKEKFNLAKQCATSGTNITAILLNNDASSAYYHQLKNIMPYIIKSEELAGAGKEISPGYRQSMIQLNKQMSNVSEEQITREVNKLIQDIMITKLKTPQDNIDTPPPTGWDSLHPDLRSVILGLVIAVPPALITVITGIAKMKKLFCFKHVSEEQENIAQENINNEENMLLAEGRINKSYNVAEELAGVARALAATVDNSIVAARSKVEAKLPHSSSELTCISPATVPAEFSSRQANTSTALNQLEELTMLGIDSSDIEVSYELVTSL
ncbi:hypothetical protein [Candidatus Tisiphia endosymbiont of Nemotelus uliginosus]|uniref:hypothetical protein n=1 Tax=Candidatus Tisiphia endosymbiont of Nemotelus uliginosus TaxID=3077926 RepID=UPI0035C928B4